MKSGDQRSKSPEYGVQDAVGLGEASLALQVAGFQCSSQRDTWVVTSTWSKRVKPIALDTWQESLSFFLSASLSPFVCVSLRMETGYISLITGFLC